MTYPIRCLIVEDEPIAAGILEDYIRQVPYLHLTGRCSDALYALEALRDEPVDLIFLDIHLPGLKGLDFVKTLQNPPQIILTTAYHDYAMAGYELGVVDYLLKPIDFERFVKAIQKVRLNLPAAGVAPATRPFYFFNVNKKMTRVWFDEILMVESMKDYVKIHLAGGRQLITKLQIGDMEVLLPAQGFLRVHRSFLVAVRHIEVYTSTELTIGRQTIPIGRQYKSDIASYLEGLSGAATALMSGKTHKSVFK